MSDHVVMLGNNRLGCLHCHDVYQLKMPLAMWEMESILEGFTSHHGSCELGPNGLLDVHGSTDAGGVTADEWRAGTDTGISSVVIWSVMTGRPRGEQYAPSPPRDPDDFGRCFRLLQRFPEWRTRLPEVSAKYPVWSLLIERWGDVEALYLEELESGRAPKTYALMRGLGA